MKSIVLAIINIPNTIFNIITLKRKHVVYGCNLTITGRLHIHGSGKIVFGEACTVNSSENSNPTAGGCSTHLGTGDSGELIIGNHVGISHAAITAKKRIEIEDYVLIGSNCMISDTDFHSIDVEERIIDDERGVKCNPIKIGAHSFIGARCIILKGVSIGKGSIIGAGSVVTKSVPEGEIWAGNPAKFIRKIDDKNR